MFRNKLSVTIIHITCWLIFLSLPLVFISDLPGSRKPWWELILTSRYWLFVLVYLLLFYGNTYFLIPKLFFSKKIVAYFGVLLLLVGLVYYLQPFDHLMSHGGRQEQPGMEHRPPPNDFRPPDHGFRDNPPPPDGQFRDGPPPNSRRRRTDLVSLFLFGAVVALALAIEVNKRWRLTEQRAAQAEAGRANAELSFLKAQINPHFLFNTLNNIYTLAVTKSEHTADSIMKLSNIMRYVTDDASEHFVSLESEVDCVRDYIDLQRLRLGKKVHLDFNVQGDLERKRIAPLIFMTFIENVFKYGISNHEDSSLVIRIFAEERTITFYSSNPVFNGRKDVERTGGIGISNTRRRLEHLYPNRHLLNIIEDEGLYTVELTLQV
ncbi:MAG TPA: histidine kinase [Chitinophaga sp.]